MPQFSIIIPTRNRPSLFAEAASSVLAQSLSDLELIAVADGPAAEHESAYVQAFGSDPRILPIRLPARANGHGPGFARNEGAARAGGEWLGFLDDDDVWCDPGYLARVAAAPQSTRADIIISSQRATSRGILRRGPIWLEDTASRLSPAPAALTAVQLRDLLVSGRFCHLNTLLVRRTLFNEVGGFDEAIRYEEDRDLFLRLLDRARLVLISSAVVAEHRIPDSSSAATTGDDTGRRLQQLRVFHKAAHHARHALIRRHGRQHLAFTLKHLAALSAADGNAAGARLYAAGALAVAPSLKGAAYAGWMAISARQRRC